MKNIIKVLVITAFSLNLLQAKATLSIDGYMPKMLFMKVKDGDFKICAELGKAYYYGNGATKDINKATKLYEKACDGKEMFGCCSLAFAGFLTA